MRLWILAITLVGVLACTGRGLTGEEVESLAATEVARALTQVPTATPNIQATVAVVVEATMAVPPTPTPDLPATIAAAVAATRVALPRATPAPMPTPVVIVVEKEVIKEVPVEVIVIKEVVKEVPVEVIKEVVVVATPTPTPTATPTPIQPPSGIVGWWPGDGNANDIVGGNHGTLEGGVTYALGVVGWAFSFDGVDDYVGVSDGVNLDITGAITLDAWIKTSGTNDHSGILDKMLG